MRRIFSLGIILLALPVLAQPALSDVAKVPRPKDGEYFGLYLKQQKVGYMFNQVTVQPEKATITAYSEYHIKAKVGAATSERDIKETRVYEAKPNGKLLSFVTEQSGDGGEQVLEATATPTGLNILRKRPGKPNELRLVKASREVVEDADQARVALKRNAKVEGTITDSQDLEQYKVTTTPGETETRTMGGVKVKLRKVVTLSEKEKVPTEAWVDEKGRMLEVRFGPMMTAVLEPPDVAKRIDLVEVFGLTRVTLPKAPPEEVRLVPAKLTLVMSGLPEKFRANTYRQDFKKLEGDRVEVTISAAPPKTKKPRPLADPNGGANLKSTIIVEADAPEIVALAKQLVAGEKDAYAAALKISRWVNANVESDYGSSSDRATDVLKTKKGDCTEHALLAVALLRAAGIPARRVDGVVYVMNNDKVPALYWHEWVEAYVGEWTQLDPTFGQDVADVTHFAVGEESSAEITPLIGSMVVHELRFSR